MADGTPRARRRIGRLVETYIPKGMTHQALADAIGVRRQTISRIISGETLVQWPTIAAALLELSAPYEVIRQAKLEHENAAITFATIEHARDLKPKYRNFRADEGEAWQERTFDPSLITGLAQSEEYALHCARAAWRRIEGETWNEKASAERRNRQAILYREKAPLKLHALIEENALYRIVGSAQVTRDALDYLLRLVSDQDNVSVQVVPRDVPAFGAYNPIVLLDFDDPQEPLGVFIEGWSGIDQIDPANAKEMDVLRNVWDDVAGIALSADDSMRAIEKARDKVSKLCI